MKINILDSSLRDGAQSTGVSYSLEDKINIIKLLDEIGIDFIEAGNPFSNPKDKALYEELEKIELKHSKIVAFGSTRRKNIKACDDKNLQAIIEAKTEYCAIFGKSSLFHVEHILETTAEENLLMIKESCEFLTSHNKKVIFDAEHFFDGFKDNPEYAMAVLEQAKLGGAIEVCLCDTNGATMPLEISEIIQKVKKSFDFPISIHCHEDCGMAVANSVIAVQSGAVGVQGTFLGIGERCGNANLSIVIPNLQLKNDFQCIDEKKIKLLRPIAKEIASINNTEIHLNMPYIGKNAFSHKAGMHSSAVLKNTASFEHINPELIGNERHFPSSEMSGKSVIIQKIKKLMPELDINSMEGIKILERIKSLENAGYQFEGADASFILLVKKRQKDYVKLFELIDYKVHIYSHEDASTRANAVVKISLGDKIQLMAGEGNGPVNALDNALRKALEIYYPEIKNVKLSDYKVRVLDTKSATASKVRVLITSTDGVNYFTTVGVSEDVVDASYKAIEDSIEYILNKWQCEKQ